MAEFCRECAHKSLGLNKEELKRAVFSREPELCEGCGMWRPVLVEIKNKGRFAAEINEEIDRTLEVLNAINSSGRMDYGDYCELHDAICEIGRQSDWCQ